MYTHISRPRLYINDFLDQWNVDSAVPVFESLYLRLINCTNQFFWFRFPYAVDCFIIGSVFYLNDVGEQSPLLVRMQITSAGQLSMTMTNVCHRSICKTQIRKYQVDNKSWRTRIFIFSCLTPLSRPLPVDTDLALRCCYDPSSRQPWKLWVVVERLFLGGPERETICRGFPNLPNTERNEASVNPKGWKLNTKATASQKPVKSVL